MGRYRENDAGLAIDASGSLLGDAFEGASGLKETLSENPVWADSLSHCATSKMMRFALGGGDAERDRCAIYDSREAFEAEGGSFQSLMKAIAMQPVFRAYVVE